nr:hypothetical protein [Alistipes onderdonkii]
MEERLELIKWPTKYTCVLPLLSSHGSLTGANKLTNFNFNQHETKFQIIRSIAGRRTDDGQGAGASR